MRWYMGMSTKDGAIPLEIEYGFKIAESYPDLSIDPFDVLTRWPAGMVRDAILRLSAKQKADKQLERIKQIKEGKNRGKETDRRGLHR